VEIFSHCIPQPFFKELEQNMGLETYSSTHASERSEM
jgi:hypothetical protein